MKAASAGMISHLASGRTTLNVCWKYVRGFDSAEYGFTNHDAIVTYDGLAYTPLSAGRLSNLSQSNRLNPDGQDMDTPFVAGAFTAAELRAGLWDNTRYYVFLINPNSIADGIIKLTSGVLGETEIKDYISRIEHRSLTQMLSTPILRLFTAECNATLGDSRCTVNTTPYRYYGLVDSVTDNRIFDIDSGSAAYGKTNGYWMYGLLEWISGENDGLNMQVDYSNVPGTQIRLVTAMPYDIAPGDAFYVTAGCDRRKTTCINKFDNVVNFRGCDMIPSINEAVGIPYNRRWVTDS